LSTQKKKLIDWQRFERFCLHPQLFEDRSVLMRARLMLYTAIAAGIGWFPMMILGYAEHPETLKENLFLGIGHLLYTLTFILLRFFSTMKIPVLVLTLVVVAQLFSGALWSGGLDSVAMFAYPIAPIFLGLIGGRLHGAVAVVSLALCSLVLYWMEQSGIAFNSSVPSRELEVITLFWTSIVGLGMVLFADRLHSQMSLQMKLDFQQRASAQSEAKVAHEVKDWFIAYFSHEMRTPLSVIEGSIDLMEHAPEGANSSRQLHALRAASRGMVRLMDDLLDISAISMGQLSLNMQPMDLGLLMQEVHQSFLASAQEKGLALALDVPEAPTIVVGDVQRYRQILSNLVGNAIKFTEAGGVELAVSLSESTVRASVSDTGIGIAEEDRQFIFEPYARAEGSGVGGTGLGLTISRQLLLQMNTDLMLDSVVGEGTSVWFDLESLSTPVVT
jgi:signal transduction histidine kinase